MFSDDGIVPNDPVFPVVVMAATVLMDAVSARAVYCKNRWGGTWEDTVPDFTRYPPDAHEVLTCIEGWGDVQIGGSKGRTFRLTPGDSIVLCAGSRVQASTDFLVAGAYPAGQENPEIGAATKENHDGMPERNAQVPLPPNCPIESAHGATIQAWKA